MVRQFLVRALNLINRLFIGPTIKYFFIKCGFPRKYRFLNTNPAAIGHLCNDIDCFPREREIGGHFYQGILLANKKNVSNAVVAKLWSKNSQLLVVTNPWLCFLLDYLRTYTETNFDCSKYIALHGKGIPAAVYKIYNEYTLQKNMIKWTPDLYSSAKYLFEKIFPNIEISKVVVLHVRDSLFDKKTKNHNYNTQKHRNSDIKSYEKILDYLNDKGFSVIRIGEYEKYIKKFHYLEIPFLKRAEIDLLNVYLTSKCAFYLGCASGPTNMAAIWGRPLFLINMLPYDILRFHSHNSMSLPKLLAKDGKILSAKEIFKNNYHMLIEDNQYEASELMISSNSAEDCMADFLEFMEVYVYKDNELLEELSLSTESQSWKEICPKSAYDSEARSLLPRHFLKKHRLI